LSSIVLKLVISGHKSLNEIQRYTAAADGTFRYSDHTQWGV